MITMKRKAIQGKAKKIRISTEKIGPLQGDSYLESKFPKLSVTTFEYQANWWTVTPWIHFVRKWSGVVVCENSSLKVVGGGGGGGGRVVVESRRGKSSLKVVVGSC